MDQPPPSRLRAALATLGWSQRYLAKRLNYDERQVRRWAACDPPPSVLEWLERLAQFHRENNSP